MNRSRRSLQASRRKRDQRKNWPIRQNRLNEKIRELCGLLLRRMRLTRTVGIYTTTNFTDEFRNVSVTLRVGADWLAERGGRGRHTLNIEKHT